MKYTKFHFLGESRSLRTSEVTAILVKGGFYLGVELHRDGSALQPTQRVFLKVMSILRTLSSWLMSKGISTVKPVYECLHKTIKNLGTHLKAGRLSSQGTYRVKQTSRGLLQGDSI